MKYDIFIVEGEESPKYKGEKYQYLSSVKGRCAAVDYARHLERNGGLRIAIFQGKNAGRLVYDTSEGRV